MEVRPGSEHIFDAQIAPMIIILRMKVKMTLVYPKASLLYNLENGVDTPYWR